MRGKKFRVVQGGMAVVDLVTAEQRDIRELTDAELLNALEKVVVAGRRRTAELLRHLAEVEDRRLHLKAGFGSMFSYCLVRWKMSEDEACRRIECARLGRKFPLVFEMLAAGEVTLTVVGLLKSYLREENHAELLRAVSNLPTRAAQEVLATRFPKPDAPSFVRKLPEPRTSPAPSHAAECLVGTLARETAGSSLARGCVGLSRASESVGSSPERHDVVSSARPAEQVSSARPAEHVPDTGESLSSSQAGGCPLANGRGLSTDSRLAGSSEGARNPDGVTFAMQAEPGFARSVEQPAIQARKAEGSWMMQAEERVSARAQRARVEPLSEGRYRVQFTAGIELKEKLELARDLMRHRNPSGDIGVVVERALELLIAELSRNRFGATSKPREKRKATSRGVKPARAPRGGAARRARL